VSIWRSTGVTCARRSLVRQTTFKRFQDSTYEDWQIIRTEFSAYAKRLPERVIAHLELLQGDFGGFPVDRLTHSLQTAALAWRDGRDDEYVVCALLHDIGDTLGTYDHPQIACAILKPFVSEANLWMLEHHNIFQGYHYFHHLGRDRDARDRFAMHPEYERTAEFCELYDSQAFDARTKTPPLSEFVPLLRRVLASPKPMSSENSRSDEAIGT
jgi:predicted HD phosphohydrolase